VYIAKADGRLRSLGVARGVKKLDSAGTGVLVIAAGAVQTGPRVDLFACTGSVCSLVRVLVRSGGERELEIVVVRHRLAILRRGGERPRYATADRAPLAAGSRLLPHGFFMPPGCSGLFFGAGSAVKGESGAVVAPDYSRFGSSYCLPLKK